MEKETVKQIINFLNDRIGFNYWWSDLDAEIKTEIVKGLENVVKVNENSNNNILENSLPTNNEEDIMALKISEKLEIELTVHEQAFYIAGFHDCIEWLKSKTL